MFQTDIVAVRTPQTEGYPFLTPRLTHTDLDTSDSEHTRQHSPPSRARSPRPQSLPGVGEGAGAAPTKRAPPPGSDIPGMEVREERRSPPGPTMVRSFANNMAEGLICQSEKEVSRFGGKSD